MAAPKRASALQKHGDKVENIVEKKPVIECLIVSGLAYLYTLVFSMFGLVFMSEIIPPFVKILLGVAFGAPVYVVFFHRGVTAGEREYRLKNKKVLADVHVQAETRINYLKPVLNMLPFVLLSILLTVLGVACRIQWLQGIMIMLFVPTTLIFMGAGLFTLAVGAITWYSVLSVSIFVVLGLAFYFGGFVKGVISLKQRNNELASEIRSFE